jgi:choline dehydrogenase
MKEQESFTTQGHWTASASRGTTGPWSVTARPVAARSTDATNLVDALVNVSGVPLVDDYNAPDVTVGGAYFLQLQERFEFPTTFPRETSATAFLTPSVMDPTTYHFVAPRRGRVQLRSTVQRLLWDPIEPTKCIGVSYIDAKNGSETKRIYATKTVVLSTGIRDAQILQIEGIGPAATLAAAEVPSRVLSEHVGRHYQNHVGFFYTFLWSAITGENTDNVPGNILTGGQVFMSDPSVAGTPGAREFQIIPFPFAGGFILICFHVVRSDEGTIDIQNGDPNKMPLVDPRYLTGDTSVASNRELIKNLTNGFAAYDASITLVSPFDINSDAEIDAYIRANVHFAHHYTSQTRMGTSINDGAIDWRGRVFGTSNLRVCSASVFPKVPDGNSCTPTVALAGLIGQMIVEDLAA